MQNKKRKEKKPTGKLSNLKVNEFICSCREEDNVQSICNGP